MRSVIIDFIKSIGIAVVLNNKVLHGLVDVYYFNWIGTDNKFYSLLAFANQTQIFSKNVKWLGDGTDNSLQDVLFNCLRVSETKEDWLLERWELEPLEKLEEGLVCQIRNQIAFDVVNSIYRVRSVSVFIQPIVGFSIFYDKDDKFHGTINVLVNSKTVLKRHDSYFFEFVEGLGLSDFVIWED